MSPRILNRVEDHQLSLPLPPSVSPSLTRDIFSVVVEPRPVDPTHPVPSLCALLSFHCLVCNADRSPSSHVALSCSGRQQRAPVWGSCGNSGAGA